MSEQLYTAEEMERYAQELVADARRGMYTAEQVAQLQVSEAVLILKGVLRNLKEVRAQRAADRISLPEGRDRQLKRMGEIWGLDTAIAAIERRIR